MWYAIIRIILSIIIGIIIILVTSFCLHRKKDKKLIISCILSTLIIYALSGFYSFENLFYSFPTPQAAFEYQKDGGDIVKLIEGEESAVIVYMDGDSPSFYVTSKDKNG